MVGLALIFAELPDGSQRLLREDGKPLQWHRLPQDGDTLSADEPLPLSEGSILGDRQWVPVERSQPQEDAFDEPPLPLDDGL